jgi:hypothetical protein
MGILAAPAAVEDLIAIATDGPAGRALVGLGLTDGCHFRTRAFATYGLGLIARANTNVEQKTRIFDALEKVLGIERGSQHDDLRIAAIHAIRLLAVDPGAGDKEQKLLQRCIATLMAFYGDGKEPNIERSRAHVPTAIATLCGRTHARKGELTKRFANDLFKGNDLHWIRQSCALALGQMASSEDNATSQVLQDYCARGTDQQTRHFCFIALGHIGGEQNRNFLLREVGQSKDLDKPRAALALGALEHLQRQADPNRAPDRIAGKVVRAEFQRARNPSLVAALAIALGLLRHTEAAGDILDQLDRNSSHDEMAGYCCLALGMLDHQPARPKINALVERSLKREERLKQGAIALGLLGDTTAGDTLVRLLEQQNSLAVFASVAYALGSIGDRRALDPLLAVFANPPVVPHPRMAAGAATDLAKAFVVVALGLIADAKEFPWNDPIARHLNYRASCETLTDGSVGVLDLL